MELKDLLNKADSTKRLTITLDAKLYKEVEDASWNHRKRMSEVVREAIVKYLDELNKS